MNSVKIKIHGGSWRAFLLGATLAAWFGHAFVSVAAEGSATTNAPGDSFQAFKIIYERNIFDPNRRPGSTGQRSRTRTAPIPTRVEAFSLAGTAISNGEPCAFFVGTESKYQKKLTLTNTIANFQIIEIAPTYVKLQSEGGELKLSMGMQMRKQDENAWELSAGTASSERPSSAPAPASISSTDSSEKTVAEKTDEAAPATQVTGTTATDEVLRRLMQKREQESK